LFKHAGQHSKQRITFEAPLLALHLHQSHNARTANCHLRTKGEKDGVKKRRTKVIFGKNHDAGTGAAAVSEKAHLRTKQH